MKKIRTRIGTLVCLALSLALAMACVASAAESKSAAIEKITVSTRVHGDGQKIEEIILTVDDASGLSGLKAEDFTLTGKNYNWRSSYLEVGTNPAGPAGYRTTEAEDFKAKVSGAAVDVKAGTVTLTVEDFSPKYYYVERYQVTCRTVESLSFENVISVQDDMSFRNSNALVEVVTPVADDFAYVTTPKGGSELTEFNYFLYTPKNASKALPLILSNHGSGDQMTLLANRVTLAWAEPGVQDGHPAYVLAPVYPQVEGTPGTAEYQDEVIGKTMALIDKMVDEGKVDPQRIYIEGKSMGGGNTVKIASRYPDVFAAAMPLCCTNSTGGTFAEAAEKLKELPMWFIVGGEDSLAENSLGFYTAIQSAGGVKAKLNVYTPEQMRARGVGKPHDVEIISLEDARYFDWMFAQTRADPTEVIDYIRVNTVSPPRGHTIDTIEVYVKDPAALKGIDSPSDFKDSKLTGNTYNWASTVFEGEYRSETTVPFEAQITGVAVDGNKLTLTMAPLKGYVDNDPAKGVDQNFSGFKKYFYVKDFAVACTANSALSFTKDVVGDTVSGQADDFTQFTAKHGGAFDYNFYAPEGYVAGGSVKEALPLVMVLHGSGDQENLLANRMAVAWTEPEIQREMPCYVLAPVYTEQAEVSDQEATTAQAVGLIRALIDNGMVDPQRVYVMGKSMGGKNTLRAYTTYPDLFAAAMPLSGGHPFEDALDAKAAVIKDKPIQIIHSVGDSSTGLSDALFAKLQELGNGRALYKKYTTEELTSEGIAVKPHDTEILAMEDVSLMRWLMSQQLTGVQFSDIQGHWAAKAIQAVGRRGLIPGAGADTFAPDAAMTYGAFVTALYHMAGQSAGSAIDWAAQQGLTSGVGQGNFAPDQALTREQAVALLFNFAKPQTVAAGDLSRFSDADQVSQWAGQSLGWAVAQGLIAGTSDGRLAPRDTLTRAQAATLLAAYLK